VPSSGNVLWSIISVMLLLTGIGALVWLMAFRREETDAEAPVSGSVRCVHNHTVNRHQGYEYVELGRMWQI
jgi:nitric oxide reductase large subunit